MKIKNSSWILWLALAFSVLSIFPILGEVFTLTWNESVILNISWLKVSILAVIISTIYKK